MVWRILAKKQEIASAVRAETLQDNFLLLSMQLILNRMHNQKSESPKFTMAKPASLIQMKMWSMAIENIERPAASTAPC